MRLLTLGGVPAEEVPYWINAANAVRRAVAGRGHGARGDRGVGLRRAGVRHARRVRTRWRWPGIEGSACLPWDRDALAGGAGSARARRGIRGSTAAPPPSASPPTGWPRAWSPRGARCSTKPPERATYTRSDRTPRAFRTFMSGLLRRIRRPGAAEETRTEATTPAPAHGSAPEAPATSEDGQRLPAGIAPEDLERRGATGRRSRLRRRARFLRRARELALRDLGGLVYEARRREQDGGKLVEEQGGAARRDRRRARRDRGHARHRPRRDRDPRAGRGRHLRPLRRAARAATPGSARTAARTWRRRPRKPRRRRARRRRRGPRPRRRRPSEAAAAKAEASRGSRATTEPGTDGRSPTAATSRRSDAERRPRSSRRRKPPTRRRISRPPSSPRPTSPRPSRSHERGRDSSARDRSSARARAAGRRWPPTRSGA